MNRRQREDIAIEAAADALLAVCALQTGESPTRAIDRALVAIVTVTGRAEQEQTS